MRECPAVGSFPPRRTLRKCFLSITPGCQVLVDLGFANFLERSPIPSRFAAKMDANLVVRLAACPSVYWRD